MQRIPAPIRRWLGVAVLAVCIIVLPFVAPSQLLGIAVFALIYALPAIGLSLLMGLAGQVSLGQAAFFAVAAYVNAILITKAGMPDVLAAAIGVASSMLIALLVGLPLLRLRGHFLALATLGLGFIVMIIVREWEFTGRTTGIYGFERPAVFGVAIDNNGYFFWFAGFFVIVCLVLALNLTRSRAGRALSAVNDSELAAESLGADTYRLRLGVFVLSAGFAGLGGVLYAYQVRIVSPQIAEFHLSVEFLLMVVLGGLGSVWGAVAGAFLVEGLSEGLRALIPALLPGASGQVQLIGYGLVLVAVIVLLPGGLVEVVRRIVRRLARPKPPPATVERVLPSVSTPLERGATILELSGLTKRYGGVVAVNDVSLSVPAGSILGLIGPNGAGKTTCFNMISGAIAPTEGTVTLLGTEIQRRKPHVAARLGLTRTFQNLQVFSSTDVVGNVYMGRYRLGKAGVVRGLLGLQGAEQRRHEQVARGILENLGLGDVADSPAADLPFGRQRMMEVCRALALEPAVLLLDEPMAGLAQSEREQLADLLRELRDAGLTIVLVEHDVAQVMALADRVAVLDDGVLIADGEPATVRDDPAVVRAYLGTDAEEAERELEALEEEL